MSKKSPQQNHPFLFITDLLCYTEKVGAARAHPAPAGERHLSPPPGRTHLATTEEERDAQEMHRPGLLCAPQIVKHTRSRETGLSGLLLTPNFSFFPL